MKILRHVVKRYVVTLKFQADLYSLCIMTLDSDNTHFWESQALIYGGSAGAPVV